MVVGCSKGGFLGGRFGPILVGMYQPVDLENWSTVYTRIYVYKYIYAYILHRVQEGVNKMPRATKDVGQ